MDVPDFLDMLCRGDLSNMMRFALSGSLNGSVSRHYAPRGPDLAQSPHDDPVGWSPCEDRGMTNQAPETTDHREVWAEAAYDHLAEVARDYRAVIEHGQLAAEIQRRTGVPTPTVVRTWIGGTLKLMTDRCVREGAPPLAALVVRKDTGMVGEMYDAVLRAVGTPLFDDPMQREEHASRARLECYRWAEAPNLAAGGGHPALAPRLAQSIARKARANPPAAKICPSCQMVLLPTGVCDSCD